MLLASVCPTSRHRGVQEYRLLVLDAEIQEFVVPEIAEAGAYKVVGEAVEAHNRAVFSVHDGPLFYQWAYFDFRVLRIRREASLWIDVSELNSYLPVDVLKAHRFGVLARPREVVGIFQMAIEVEDTECGVVQLKKCAGLAACDLSLQAVG